MSPLLLRCSLVLVLYVAPSLSGGVEGSWLSRLLFERTAEVKTREVTTALPDSVAYVGELFAYDVSSLAGDQTLNEEVTFAVREQGQRDLPRWLYFDDSTSRLFGVAEHQDVGEISLEVIRKIKGKNLHLTNTFQVEVTTEQRHPASKSLNCALTADEQVTIAKIVLDADLLKMNAKQRVELLGKSAIALQKNLGSIYLKRFVSGARATSATYVEKNTLVELEGPLKQMGTGEKSCVSFAAGCLRTTAELQQFHEKLNNLIAFEKLEDQLGTKILAYFTILKPSAEYFTVEGDTEAGAGDDAGAGETTNSTLDVVTVGEGKQVTEATTDTEEGSSNATTDATPPEAELKQDDAVTVAANDDASDTNATESADEMKQSEGEATTAAEAMASDDATTEVPYELKEVRDVTESSDAEVTTAAYVESSDAEVTTVAESSDNDATTAKSLDDMLIDFELRQVVTEASAASDGQVVTEASAASDDATTESLPETRAEGDETTAASTGDDAATAATTAAGDTEPDFEEKA